MPGSKEDLTLREIARRVEGSKGWSVTKELLGSGNTAYLFTKSKRGEIIGIAAVTGKDEEEFPLHRSIAGRGLREALGSALRSPKSRRP